MRCKIFLGLGSSCISLDVGLWYQNREKETNAQNSVLGDHYSKTYPGTLQRQRRQKLYPSSYLPRSFNNKADGANQCLGIGWEVPRGPPLGEFFFSFFQAWVKNTSNYWTVNISQGLTLESALYDLARKNFSRRWPMVRTLITREGLSQDRGPFSIFIYFIFIL